MKYYLLIYLISYSLSISALNADSNQPISTSCFCDENPDLIKASKLFKGIQFTQIINDPLISVIDESQANEIFKRILDLNYELRFNAYKDGCEARSFRISMYLSELNLKTAKVFVNGPLYPKIDVNHKWNYHVASFIGLRQRNGLIIPIILDPTTNRNTYLTFNTWWSEIGGKFSSPRFITNQFIFAYKDLSKYKDEELNWNYFREEDIQIMRDHIFKL